MLSGITYRHKIVANGARQIVSIHMAGDLVDLQNSLLGTADHNVQALTDAGSPSFRGTRSSSSPSIARAIGKALWYDTLVDGSIFREWIANVGRRDARTASPICSANSRCGSRPRGWPTIWNGSCR